MKKIKPCPSCGGKAILVHISYDNLYWVSCNDPNCLMHIGTYTRTEPEAAIEIWNHRPGEEEAYRRGVQGLPMEGDDTI